MGRMSDYPSFDDALAQFRRFAQAQGAPAELMFVLPGDVVVSGQYASVRRPPHAVRSEQARAAYEDAVARDRGVEIAGVLTCDGRLGTYVYVPTTDEEAAENWVPKGLKLSVRTPLVKGMVAGWVVWPLLRWREKRHPASREWKNLLFGGSTRPN